MTDRSLAPLARGDLVVTATRLVPGARYPTGLGAVRQLDPDGRTKAEALTGATGLVAGLACLDDGSLLALDPQARHAARFAADGTRLPDPDLGGHPFGSLVRLPGGDLLLGEHLCGPSGPFAGGGLVHRVSPDLTPVGRYATEVNGGVAGFLGVTHMALSGDGQTLFHLSETGPHLYGHDLAADRRLGALFTLAEPPAMLFGLAAVPGGDLVVATGSGLLRLCGGRAGFRIAAPIALPAPERGRPGWANVFLRPGGRSIFALDFLGGRLAEVDLEDHAVTRLIDLGLGSSLASLVEVP
ncbi:hypothetical protein [Thermaurantiacus sp.]